MEEIVKELKSLVSVVESLESFGKIYPLTTEQFLELRDARYKINKIIKKI